MEDLLYFLTEIIAFLIYSKDDVKVRKIQK